MTGVAAIALCAAFTSCSSKDELYNPDVVKGNEAASIVEKYNQAFLKYVGGTIAPDQTWGFGGYETAAKTRVAAVNSNQWFDGVTEQFKHLVKPADVTAREEEVVSKWFQDNQHPTCDEILLTEFFVQQVYFGTKEYTAKDNNNAEHKVIGGQHMDYLYAGTVDNKDHINNFNTSAPKRTDTGLQNMQLMQNSSTANFGYHESFNSQNQRYYLEKNRNWVIKAISVDGVIGYYVGFDYESHGNQGDFEPDGYFDDRIIKIVPGTGYPKNDDVCIIAEDLSADDDTDFDFNDVVFTVHYTSDNTADVTLYAAGGTLPLTVAGYEVHDKFGFPDPDPKTGKYKMINTGAKADVNDVATVTFTVSGISKSNRGNDIAITVNKGTAEAPNWIPLTATGGKPAAKLCVGVDFATGKKWCAERESIKGKYPVFSQWVASNPTQIWWK